jgi:hypothetical protein
MLDDAKLLASAICLDYSSYLNIRLPRAKFKMIEVFMSGRADEVIRGVEGVLPGESATARAAHESLKGGRRGIRKLLPFLGPAFIAAVAYVDPGNFATNISGGAQFGYLLLWVILASNLRDHQREHAHHGRGPLPLGRAHRRR